jgi:hypothetical protein
MAYRLTYSVNIDYVGPGTGVQGGSVAPALPQGGRGGAQTFQMSNAQGGQNTNTLTSGTITTITNAMATDIAAQLNASLARLQGFASGTD